MGSVLDGIPESFVLGLTVLQGGVSVPLLVGVAISNLPEGMASSSGLRVAGWMVLGARNAHVVARGLGIGALLTMLTNTMLPEAFQEERDFTGALVVLGFAGSIALAAL